MLAESIFFYKNKIFYLSLLNHRIKKSLQTINKERIIYHSIIDGQLFWTINNKDKALRLRPYW